MPPGPREDDAPRPGGGRRGRTVIAVILAVLVVLVLSMRAIATFWTDFLWFDDLGLSMVWTRLLSARVSLAVAATVGFFLLAWVNLTLAERLSPQNALATEDDIPERYQSVVAGRQRLVIFLVSLVVALLPGIGAAAEWQKWLLFRHGGSFGIEDPEFATDLGFYVFKLPFLSQLVDWTFGFLLVTLLLVVALYYLNGAIRVQGPGDRMSSAAKGHLSVVLALLALVRAADYWLQRYELTFQSRSSFDGAGYTAVNASLPALQLLILVALFAAGLFLLNIRRRGWVLPVIAIALWGVTSVVLATIYPAFVQRFQVSPAELQRETEFIERNISATRVALGLDDIETTEFEYEPGLTREAIEAQAANLEFARLLDPNEMRDTFQALEFGREFYTFRDLDMDRYQLSEEGPRTPTIISTRELRLSGVPDPTWEKLHLVFTHGYAAAAAPANEPNSRGEPDFLVGGIPVRSRGNMPALENPELYVGEQMEGYAIVGTDQQELSADNLVAEYDGDNGVPIDSFVRKAAFSLRFGEIEPLISNLLTEDSRVIYIRDAVERVRTIAPFLTYDIDPYPVIIDGRVTYVIDAYTTASTYPYAQSLDASRIADGQQGTFNYIRNSVKATVDAYDGTVTLYYSDVLYGEEDPVIRAWGKAFPGLFVDEIPPALAEHFRYPELLFRTQTEAWGRYHQERPSTFFNNSDRWAVAQAPPTDASGAAGATTAPQAGLGDTGVTQFSRIDPYYQVMQLTPDSEPEFVLTRPFVLASQDDSGRNLVAYMVARNDPGSYGRLEQFVVAGANEGDSANRVDGPLLASEKIATYPPVSQYQTLVGQRGSSVQYGNILLLPFGDSLMYVRPIYARQESSGRNTLQRVAVTAGENVGFGESLQDAIEDLFATDPQGQTPGAPLPEESIDLPDEDIADPDGDEPDTTTPPPSGSPGELLAEAESLFARADEALAAGDLGEYQRLIREARAAVEAALAGLGAAGGTDDTTTTTAAVGET